MIEIATIVGLALAFVTVVVAGVRVLRSQAADTAEVAAAGVLELGLLFYVVVRAVDLAGGHRVSSTTVAIAYLVGILLVMPVAVALGLAERSRWGPAVIGVGALVVAVLFARIAQVWHG